MSSCLCVQSVFIYNIHEKNSKIFCTYRKKHYLCTRYRKTTIQDRNVAQLVAHYVRDVGVGRSSRLIPTKAAREAILSPLSFSYSSRCFQLTIGVTLVTLDLYFARYRFVYFYIACTDNLKKIEPCASGPFLLRIPGNLEEVGSRTSGSFLPRILGNLEEVELCLTAGGSRREHLRIVASSLFPRPRRGRTTHVQPHSSDCPISVEVVGRGEGRRDNPQVFPFGSHQRLSIVRPLRGRWKRRETG